MSSPLAPRKKAAPRRNKSFGSLSSSAPKRRSKSLEDLSLNDDNLGERPARRAPPSRTKSFGSKSSHAKDEFCSITVRKDSPAQKAGIRLEQEKSTGRIKVANIATNGLFTDSEVSIGDIVLSINGKRLQPGEGPDALVDVIRRADYKVTMTIKKAGMRPRRAPRPAKNPDDLVDNNKTTKDNFYRGVARHKSDGSLDFGHLISTKGGKKKTVLKAEAAKETTTISASKKDGQHDAGLTFVVKENILRVKSIALDSVFLGTDLEVGDKIVSICDMNFRGYVDAKYATTILRKANKFVALVVEKEVGVSSISKPKRRLKSGAKTTTKKASGSRSIASDATSISDLSTGSTDSCSSSEDFAGEKNKVEQITIAAPKKFSTQRVGVDFRQVGNELRVKSITERSIFHSTTLRVGDRVIAINDMSFKENPDKNKAITVCTTTKESVSFLVLRNISTHTEGEFSLDGSGSELTWK